MILPLLAAASTMIGCSKNHLTSPELASNPSRVGAPVGGARNLAPLKIAEDDASVGPRPSGAIPIATPTIITEPGVYRVIQDFAVDEATGTGVVVRASGVHLWLGDHTISGPGAKVGRGIALENVERVLVEGGILMNFGVGVALDGAHGCVVRGVRVVGADEFADPANGIPPQVGVLLVNSAYNRISRNKLERINLGLFVRGGESHGNAIRRNRVVGGGHGLLGVCYNPAPDAGPDGPAGDDVARNILSRFEKGIQASAGSARNRFTRNTIEYFLVAYQDLNGANVFLRNDAIQVTP